jgi:hypothetical protein
LALLAHQELQICTPDLFLVIIVKYFNSVAYIC